MNHADMIDNYSRRALTFARQLAHVNAHLPAARAAGLKSTVRAYTARRREFTAAIIDSANVIIAERTLQAAADRLASVNAAGVMMPDPFNPDRGARATRHPVSGAQFAYFLPLTR